VKLNRYGCRDIAIHTKIARALSITCNSRIQLLEHPVRDIFDSHRPLRLQVGKSGNLGTLDPCQACLPKMSRTVTSSDGSSIPCMSARCPLVGAECVVFVYAGVSVERTDAIARYGARTVRVKGNYDDAIAEASRQAAASSWIVVSATSWPGYERIPHRVVQGYTAMLSEAVDTLPQRPTHVFIQAGVGGIAAAVAAFFHQVYDVNRPLLTVVDPSRAACLFESARAGKAVKIAPDAPAIMAILECHEPSPVAWRILSRLAGASMTVNDDEAVAVMRRLARPSGEDPAIVAGESGGVGPAGLIQGLADDGARQALGLNPNARVFLINSEGATDPALYERLVGNLCPDSDDL
jgi:diaminopropionate ammonia-lyase